MRSRGAGGEELSDAGCRSSPIEQSRGEPGDPWALNASGEATLNWRHHHAVGIVRLDDDCGSRHGLEASDCQSRLSRHVGFEATGVER